MGGGGECEEGGREGVCRQGRSIGAAAAWWDQKAVVAHKRAQCVVFHAGKRRVGKAWSEVPTGDEMGWLGQYISLGLGVPWVKGTEGMQQSLFVLPGVC